MKRALIVANAASMIYLFNSQNIKTLQDEGYEVHVACNFLQGNTISPEMVEECNRNWVKDGVICHHIDFLRTPFSLKSFDIYKQTKDLIKSFDFDIIHCHTPIVSVFVRLAARKARKKKNTKVIYTAHGFHFFKGAPLQNWLIYLPVEWLCSFITDTLITINNEDFTFAKKHMHAKEIGYIPGIGVDTAAFRSISVDRDAKREELGIPKDCIAVLSVGELNENKNHETVLRAIAKLERKDIYYVICGVGSKKEYLINLSRELGMENRLILPGYRKDIGEINHCCDIFAFPSKREGLGLAALEAMASGLPIVGSNIHGIPDYLIDGKSGFRCSREDVDAFAEKIAILSDDKELRLKMGENNLEEVKKYDSENVKRLMADIYPC